MWRVRDQIPGGSVERFGGRSSLINFLKKLIPYFIEIRMTDHFVAFVDVPWLLNGCS